MKKIILAILGFFFFHIVEAQQDPMYSQYMFNLYSINPAYAGSRNLISANMFYRTQWTGLSGAPKSSNFSLHSPIAQSNSAVGVNFYNDRLGVHNQTFVNASYSYKIQGKKSFLSLGISGGFYQYLYNWDQLVLDNPVDPVFSGQDRLFLPNLGAGAFYQAEKFAVGLSVPRIFTHQIISSNAYEIARPKNHWFATASYLININENFDFKPAVMARFVQNAPIQTDWNGTFIYKKQWYMGVSYRTLYEFSLMAQYRTNSGLMFGYAYDVALAKVYRLNSRGSHEFFLSYEFSLNKKKLLSPRYF